MILMKLCYVKDKKIQDQLFIDVYCQVYFIYNFCIYIVRNKKHHIFIETITKPEMLFVPQFLEDVCLME